MRRTIITAFLGLALTVTGAASASADEVPVTDFSSVEGLSAEQLAAIASLDSSDTISVAPTKTELGTASAASSSSRRASFYRGSALMWTRDNVDFGYNWSKVTWTSPYQQAGWIWPSVARNKGISKYYDTVRDDRFRAVNSYGAGVPTPWGDVKVYSVDYVHRLSVKYNGAWSAWAD